MTDDLYTKGEDRHMRCRHGKLTGAIAIDVDEIRRAQDDERTPKWEPADCLPLCLFKPSTPYPPAIDRAWGGLVEFERDCAVCGAFQELEAKNIDEASK